MTLQKALIFHMRNDHALFKMLTLALAGSILASCAVNVQGTQNSNSLYPTDSSPQPGSDQPIEPTQSATDAVNRTIWLDPLLPLYISAGLNLPSGWTLADQDQAGLSVSFGKGIPVSHWILALTSPFPTLLDEVSDNDLLKLWQGSSDGSLSGKTLLMSQAVFHALTLTWGKTTAKSIQILDDKDLLQTAWDSAALAIIPFDHLEPRWKVITINGQTPIHNDFDPTNYFLSIPITLQGESASDALSQELEADGNSFVPVSNRDPSKMTVLAMTGVTALVRTTAFVMEQKGITYPGQAVRKWLASADITHISNEAAFADNCPPPRQYDTHMVFCSSPKYIELLEYVGTDIVELTGDHLADWGKKATYLTLEMYKKKGWQVYGGGENLEEGKKPLLIEHNGNKLAFIGCNAKGSTYYATASETTPGAVPCDYQYVGSEVQRLANLGWLPIVSIQHYEYDTYEAQEIQIRDFRRMADSGAVIVSGSQSHRPQGMEFDGNTFLHYGLGNLFFDQYGVGEPNRQGFIDRHVFYDNRYISTELVSTYLIDYAQPQIMTGQKRQNLLETIFTASGWQPIP